MAGSAYQSHSTLSAPDKSEINIECNIALLFPQKIIFAKRIGRRKLGYRVEK